MKTNDSNSFNDSPSPKNLKSLPITSIPSPALTQLAQRTDGLRIFSDDTQTRICIPVASSQIIFQNSTNSAERSAGELVEIIESVFGGKFQLPVEATAAMEPASGRTVSDSGNVGSRNSSHSNNKPLATIEIWSLEPGSFDLVLRVPNHVCRDDALALPLIGRFADQAREVSRTMDNLDILRFHEGPSLSLRDAHRRLNRLEIDCGTRLDTEGLLHILNKSLL
jgi:hypothetical protein